MVAEKHHLFSAGSVRPGPEGDNTPTEIVLHGYGLSLQGAVSKEGIPVLVHLTIVGNELDLRISGNWIRRRTCQHCCASSCRCNADRLTESPISVGSCSRVQYC